MMLMYAYIYIVNKTIQEGHIINWVTRGEDEMKIHIINNYVKIE